MSTVPAFCTHCQSIFPFSIAPFFGSGANIQSLGFWNTETTCPVCRQKAQISNGVYNVTNGAVELVSGTKFTRAAAESLKRIAEQALSKKITAEEAVKQAEQVSPRGAKVIDSALKFGLPGLALVVSVLSLYLQNQSYKSSGTHAQKLLDAVSKQTYVLEQINENYRVDDKRTTPAQAKADHKLASTKDPSTRRAEVKKHRRDALKKRRTRLGQSRTH